MGRGQRLEMCTRRLHLFCWLFVRLGCSSEPLVPLGQMNQKRIDNNGKMRACILVWEEIQGGICWLIFYMAVPESP